MVRTSCVINKRNEQVVDSIIGVSWPKQTKTGHRQLCSSTSINYKLSDHRRLVAGYWSSGVTVGCRIWCRPTTLVCSPELAVSSSPRVFGSRWMLPFEEFEEWSVCGLFVKLMLYFTRVSVVASMAIIYGTRVNMTFTTSVGYLFSVAFPVVAFAYL